MGICGHMKGTQAIQLPLLRRILKTENPEESLSTTMSNESKKVTW
jgi:hypothetical protein